MTLQETPISADDLRRARDTGGVEFVNGQLVEKPVSKESSRIAARILFLLQQHVEKLRGGPTLAGRGSAGGDQPVMGHR